jgi:hypothetical protein
VPTTELSSVATVRTTDLPAAALPSGSGAGNSLYDCLADGVWTIAPNAAAEATYNPPFTAVAVTIMVRTASIRVRFSADGANYGERITLPPGLYPFATTVENMQYRQDVDGTGAELQIVAFA